MPAIPLAHIHLLEQLIEAFFAFLRGQIAAGKNKPKSLDYYKSQLIPWAATLPGMALKDIIAFHLTGAGGATWHRIQAAQRLFTWSVKQHLITDSPFRDIRKPALGQRTRVLTQTEQARLLWGADPRRKTPTKPIRKSTHFAPWRPLRWVLFTMARTLARPGEIRIVRWADYDPRAQHFIIRDDFKAKESRRDRAAARIIPVTDPTLIRVLATWFARRKPKSKDFIYLTRNGLPWSKDGLVHEVARARARAGLEDGGEHIVAYTQRHTAATRAAEPDEDGMPGANLSQIAEVMGHSTTRMTERYIHLHGKQMGKVIKLATRRNLSA